MYTLSTYTEQQGLQKWLLDLQLPRQSVPMPMLTYNMVSSIVVKTGES
jgi:hypothetical protein